MRLTLFKNTLFLLVLFCFSCGSGSGKENAADNEDIVIHDMYPLDEVQKKNNMENSDPIVVGAERFDVYKKFLQNKKVGVVANQTSVVTYRSEPDNSLNAFDVEMHLVDFLLRKGISVKKVFSPEHGFRGEADAGEAVKDGVDTNTGLPIVSLYGKNKKPFVDQLKDLDVMVFDMQDVGVRFYTYVSTMHYIMEAAAENGIPVIVMDRPNPNGHYIDGPMMEEAHRSFLGMHPVPLVHGMTMGEYAQMINGEGWLSNGVQCELEVIQMENYTHDTVYSVPIRPSPNLPNDTAINLYPSLGLLEGTNLNAGRGTEMQFQIFGSPHLPAGIYTFRYTPQPNFGSKNPKHKGTQCNGLDLRDTPRMNKVDLSWIIEAYKNHTRKNEFFNTKNFTAHAGTAKLQKQIEQGLSMEDIRNSWQDDLKAYNAMRKKYLLYD
ncbi:DUF1343 domain-containing protein [Pukyongia salina]|uniref:DUF1343 domain-containing protein n=1 Tax=Pukyongia salina TaxID=2094025 RepID=A0A2S0HTD3_9FLAO|nr:DUF1343 domain-containing protein [Pukyongia salina]AVI49916.1 DUF1343 domain-containing protein [Pukyongia salina]